MSAKRKPERHPKSKHSERVRRRLSAFSEIVETHCGTVEGVTIDLRHPMIDPSCWSSPALGGWHVALSGFDEPPLIFPWVKRIPLKKRIRQAHAWRKEHPEWCLENVSEEIGKITSEFHSEIVLASGDRISIFRVECIENSDPFAPGTDHDALLAFLCIERTGGEPIYPAEPIVFYSHGSFLAPGLSGRVTFENVARRILTAWKRVQNISSKDNPQSILDVSWPEDPTADDFPDGPESPESELVLGVQILVEEIEQLDAAARTRDEFNVVRRAIDRAVALGYGLAMYECNQTMRTKATAALNSRDGARKAGVKRGQAKKAEAQSARAQILSEATKIRKEIPSISQSVLAFDIEEILRRKIGRKIGHRAIEGHIRELERSGELPRARRAGKGR